MRRRMREYIDRARTRALYHGQIGKKRLETRDRETIFFVVQKRPTLEYRYLYRWTQVESLASRAVAVANRRPAASAWRPIRKPRLYDVLKQTRAKLASVRASLDTPAALRSHSETFLGKADAPNEPSLPFDDDDIDEFD